MTVPDPSLQPMLALLAYLPAAARDNMVRMYLAALDEHVALIDAALQRQDDAALASAVHKIAGSSGMMQDQPLSQAARSMEVALREGRGHEARGHWSTLKACAVRTRQALQVAYPESA